MQNKIYLKIHLILLSALCLTLTTIVFAGGYYSSGPIGSSRASSGYYSSSNMGGYYSSSATPNGQNFYVALNMPPYMGYVDTHPTYFVAANQRHYHHHYGKRYPLWVDAFTGSMLPHHAVIGGEQPGSNHTLFICRADYLGGVHPGKLHNGKCTFTYHGNEIRTNQYQVLVSRHPLHWLSASFGMIPSNSIVGGHEEGNPFYVCQADYLGGKVPGKMIGNQCHIGYEGREITTPYYQLLVA